MTKSKFESAYLEAKDDFFGEFLDSEKKITTSVEDLSLKIAEHIHRAYSNYGFSRKIVAHIDEILQLTHKATQVADALDLKHEKITYRSWRTLAMRLHKNVNAVHTQSVVEREVFGSGRLHHLVEKKLTTDSAIIAVDVVLEHLYQSQRVSGRRRILYHGAGLLHYGGYESFDLKPSQPFPSRLYEEDITRQR